MTKTARRNRIPYAHRFATQGQQSSPTPYECPSAPAPSGDEEHLVAIAVRNVETPEGLTIPEPAKSAATAAVQAAQTELQEARNKLENLLILTESGKASASILDRITETEKQIEKLEGKRKRHRRHQKQKDQAPSS